MNRAVSLSPAYRFAAVFGALACMAAVALGAWAAHGAEALARERLEAAALYLFLHGLALAIFAPQQRGVLAATSLLLWIAGCVFFCGSLVAAVRWGTPTMLTPFGGMAFMLGWLARAAALLRRA